MQHKRVLVSTEGVWPVAVYYSKSRTCVALSSIHVCLWSFQGPITHQCANNQPETASAEARE